MRFETKRSLRAKLDEAKKSLHEMRFVDTNTHVAEIRGSFDLIGALTGESHSSLRTSVTGLIDLGVIPERYRSKPLGDWSTAARLLDGRQIGADLDAIRTAEQVKQGEILLAERAKKEAF